MRMSRLLIKTWKTAPADAELPGHQLLLRAGLIQRVAAGIYSLTPLAWRAVRRLMDLIRAEMDALGGQELLLPVVQPAELWQASGRYAAIDETLARFADRTGHPMVLAMTHEEAAAQLVGAMAESYRQLPLLIYQIQTKFRDELRPRAGLIRLREFLMKDAYSFHSSPADLNATYQQVVEAYQRIFAHLNLPTLVVESDTGLMGGGTAHEFMLVNSSGEETLITCPQCGYSANQEVARFRREDRPEDWSGTTAPAPYPLHTPGAKTIAELCACVECQPEQTLKSVFFRIGSRLVLALVPGHLEVNSLKLGKALGAEVAGLSLEEAAAAGLCPGYAGPVDLDPAIDCTLVADESIKGAKDLITGANRPDTHLGGVCCGRDFTPHLFADIALAEAGLPCRVCGAPLQESRGIELANTFQLGTHYAEALGARFTAADGAGQPMWMGCYRIGLTRLLGCLTEHCRDENGLIWPEAVAPYRFHLLAAGKDSQVYPLADQLHEILGPADVLYDDRDVSIGVKLKDADLLGMPLRVTVSDRSLAAGGVEIRQRRTGESSIVAPEEAAAAAAAIRP